MLGGFLKLAWSFSVLFVFVTIIWQASITNALPTVEADDNMVKSNDDASRSFDSNIHTGGPVVKRSLRSTVDQEKLIDRSYPPLRQRHSKKFLILNLLNLQQIFFNQQVHTIKIFELLNESKLY